MVTLSFTVLTSLPVLTASQHSEAPSVALSSTIPEKELIAMLTTKEDTDAFSDNTIPQNEIVAMLATPPVEPITSPTQPPTPAATMTPAPQPTATPISIPPTETPTPIPTATPTPQVATTASPTDLESLFSRYSDEYHVDRELLRRIAACESGFNTTSHNTTYDYGGMYQFSLGTWTTIRGRMGADQNPELRFSAEESIKTAAYHIANGGQGAWPNCK